MKSAAPRYIGRLNLTELGGTGGAMLLAVGAAAPT
jgi:hypothetical protein